MSESSKIRNYDVLKEEPRKQIEIEEQAKRESIDKEAQEKLASIAEDDQRKTASLDEEARRRDEDEQKKYDALRLEDKAKQNADRLAQQAQEMQAVREAHKRLEAYRKEQAQTAAEARQQTQDKGPDAPEGEIRNAHSRYAQALGQHYDVRDPYASLARSSMAEYRDFMRDRDSLDRQIAQTKDPAARERLEMRKEIEGADYMALTSDRIATQSELITGKLNSEEAQKQRARAEAYREQSKELRGRLRERQQGRDGAAPEEKGKAAERTGPRPPTQQHDSPRPPPSPQVEPQSQQEQDRLARAKARTEALRKDSQERQRSNRLER